MANTKQVLEDAANGMERANVLFDQVAEKVKDDQAAKHMLDMAREQELEAIETLISEVEDQRRIIEGLRNKKR